MKTTFNDLPAEMQERLREKARILSMCVSQAMAAGIDSADTLDFVREVLPWVEDKHIPALRKTGDLLLADVTQTGEYIVDRIVLMLIEDESERAVN